MQPIVVPSPDPRAALDILSVACEAAETGADPCEVWGTVG